jgi:hypothetical protein
MRIGLDLDNTLIRYDGVWAKLAQEAGLSLDASDKPRVRAAVRSRLGEEAWQSFQAAAYGERIMEAGLYPGVLNALRSLKNMGHSLSIISHKTRHTARYGENGPDLHAAAGRFLEKSGLAALVDEVVFTLSREEKCASIARSGCEYFVDDVSEVFAHPVFPKDCIPVLFGADGTTRAFFSWSVLPLLLFPDSVPHQALEGGRNGRVSLVGGAVLKRYPRDGRPRCPTEWQALRWCDEHRPGRVPAALAHDFASGFAIMEYVEGTRPNADASSLVAMSAFACNLYGLRDKSAGLPQASAACFSLREIEAQLAARLSDLALSPSRGEVRCAMHDFLRDDLAPATADNVKRCPDFGTLPDEFRMPSPSDVGLHNAVLTDAGQLCFLDFEYFGLDDPAKLLADVTLHPGMELTPAQSAAFREPLLAVCEKAGDVRIRQRYAGFLPLWRLAWCCILLNDFRRREHSPRCFSESCAGEGENLVLARQLAKAERMFKGAARE